MLPKACFNLTKRLSTAIFFWGALGLIGSADILQAQGPQVKLHTPSYQDGKGFHYVEFTLFCLTESLFQPLDSKKPRSLDLEILVVGQDSARQRDSITMGDKVRLNAPEGLPIAFSHLLRYKIADGTYGVQIVIRDPNSSAEPALVNGPLRLKTNSETCFLSELRIGEQLSPEKDGSPFNRYGFEFKPLVGDAILPLNSPELPLFFEIYNSDKLGLPEGERLQIKLEVLDRYLRPVPGLGGTLKRDVRSVIPVLLSLPIEILEPGDYILRAEIGEVGVAPILTSETEFRKPSDLQNNQTISSSEAVDHRLETYFENEDTLNHMLDILYPISSLPERRQESNLMISGSIEQKRNFLIQFWLARDPIQPEKALNEYLLKVSEADRSYGARSMKGYQTDRGRVFLQFGNPNMIEDRKYEPSMYPYEIWQYNVLNSASTNEEVNRVFIFANTESAGDLYRIIHSNAEGETFNQRWMLMLNRRMLPLQSVDETGEDIIQHGGRVNSNPIINESTINSINRR